MATNKETKVRVMEEVRSILAQGANLVVTEYRGLDVQRMTELRSGLRKAGVKFKILKNTLLKKLLGEKNITELEPHLRGPVGIAFLGRDVAAASKAIIGFAKKNELFVIKAGYIEGALLNLQGIKTIASLPSREVMLAILLGTLQAPLQGFLRAAQGNTQKLIYVLNAWREKKMKLAV